MDKRKNAKSIWDEMAELLTGMPTEELVKLPRDGAERHDYYIYKFKHMHRRIAMQPNQMETLEHVANALNKLLTRSQLVDLLNNIKNNIKSTEDNVLLTELETELIDALYCLIGDMT